MERPKFARHIEALPASVPFVAPETLERMTGHSIRLRLGANESPFGVSPLAAEAMRDTIPTTAYYGEPESAELRHALVEKHGVAFEEIAVGSGIDDLLGLIARVYLNPGDPVVTSLGGYPTFDYHVKAYGGQLTYVPYQEDWHNDLAGLADAAHKTQARLVYLANPDNPTGTFYEAEALRQFMASLPADTTLLLDEAYIEFADTEGQLPMTTPCPPNLIRLRTFSKAFGMAGARIGYAIAHRDVVATFDKVRHHFGVNRLAQAGALAALGDREFLTRVRQQVQEGRIQLSDAVRKLGFHPLPSSTSFLCVHVGNADLAKRIVDEMLAHGVFLRAPGAPKLNECVRITIGTREMNDELITALQKVVHSN